MQVKELFHCALEMEPERRKSFLSEACSNDPELLAEVETLIAADQQEGSFIDTPAYEAAAELLIESGAQSYEGQTIGHYTVVSLLGKGGMGEVYLAEDPRLGRRIALKMPPSFLIQDKESLDRFVHEARTASSLNHPNIITVHDVGEADGSLYIATEFIEGQTLRHHLTERRLEVTEAIDIAIQIASALGAAHRAGIVHRDIKPENVMVRPDGWIKVLDFGLARMTEQRMPARSDDATIDGETGLIMGTVSYMSPEQAQGLAVDARTDIFSLGVMLYEMIAGRLPFEGPTIIDKLESIIHKEPPPLAQQFPEVPAEMERIVTRALKKEREERYQTIDELLGDLKRVKGELEFEEKLDKSGARAARRRVYIAASVLAVVVIALWYFIGPGNRSDENLLTSLAHKEIHTWRTEPGEGYILGNFSPDGNRVAFSAIRNGRTSVWIKDVSGGEPVQIAGDQSYSRNPIWSPDGQEIAFISGATNEVGIWRIPSKGGAPVLITTLKTPSPRLRRWSRDGATIYYEAPPNLFALDVASGDSTQITGFDLSKASLGNSTISPDEKRIAFVDERDGQYDIWVMPVGGGAPVQITNDATEDRNPIWHPDGKRIIYSSKRDGVYQICVAWMDGRPPLQITFGESNRFVADVSTDGAKILYGTSKEESDIWGVKLETGEEFPVTPDIGCELWPDISPDGKMIAFQAIREPSQGANLYQCSILARPIETESRQVQIAGNGFDPQWSPDGSRLAFLRQSDNMINIWTVKIAGGTETPLTARGIDTSGYTILPYNRTQTKNYSWSPDGAKIVYCSGQSGAPNIWMVSADGSGEIRVSNNTDPALFFQCPMWLREGRRIAYMSSRRVDKKDIWNVSVMDVRTGESRSVFQSDSALRLLGWSQSSNEVLIATSESRSSALQTGINLIQVSVSGNDHQIVRLKAAYLSNIHLSPDGRIIAFASHQDGKDNIWTIPSNGGEAKKVTANIEPRLYFSTLAWSPDGKAIYYGKQLRHSLVSVVENFK